MSEPKTLRETVAEKLLALRDIDSFGPHKASEELVALSSLLASISKECSDRRYIYSLKKIQLLEEHKTAAKANIYGQGSMEFKDLMEAEDYRAATIDMIRSIKYYLKISEAEFGNMTR